VTAPLLDVQELRVAFASAAGSVQAVQGLSFRLERGRTLAVVGESGSGKSVTALSIVGLLPAAKVEGHIRLDGSDLLGLSERDLRQLRGAAIGMVFQEPMTSLNPVLTIGEQVREAVQLHRPMARAQLRARALELLAEVGIAAPARVVGQYPHQLSGGMRQRVMIAIALACDPPILIADEPTTALDVTVQAQILALIRQRQERSNCGVLLITHDLGVVAELADRVVVLYAGRAVEEADVADIFERPAHPYTRGLLGARATVGEAQLGVRRRLAEIPGTAPQAGAPGRGCAFAARCPNVQPRCLEVRPELRTSGGGRLVACHLALAPAFA
jgi:peptide/nickel transport system ATP-binding protein